MSIRSAFCIPFEVFLNTGLIGELPAEVRLFDLECARLMGTVPQLMAYSTDLQPYVLGDEPHDLVMCGRPIDETGGREYILVIPPS